MRAECTRAQAERSAGDAAQPDPGSYEVGAGDAAVASTLGSVELDVDAESLATGGRTGIGDGAGQVPADGTLRGQTSAVSEYAAWTRRRGGVLSLCRYSWTLSAIPPTSIATTTAMLRGEPERGSGSSEKRTTKILDVLYGRDTQLFFGAVMDQGFPDPARVPGSASRCARSLGVRGRSSRASWAVM